MLDKMRTFVDNVSVALDGPHGPVTSRERLLENWTRIQEYYGAQRQDDLQRLAVTDTTIPHHLECMLKELAQEMVNMAQHRSSGELLGGQALEFGPCVEYLLQYHILSDLVDLAERDQPRGLRAYVVRFFTYLIDGMPLVLLPESAVRLPLVAILRQCVDTVQAAPTALVRPKGADILGVGFASVLKEKPALILCHEMLHLIVALFTRLREHSGMAQLFFDWSGNQARTTKADLAITGLRSAAQVQATQSARGHELFLVHIIVEYLLAPGIAGQLAREALALMSEVLLTPNQEQNSQYVLFLLEHARIVELLVEHMGYLHAQMPATRPMPRSSNSQLFSATYDGMRRMAPLQRREYIKTKSGREIGGEAVARRKLRAMLSQDGTLRSSAQMNQREAVMLNAARQGILEHVDAFFLCWDLLDEIAVLGVHENQIEVAIQSQLTNGFLRTHIEPALLATGAMRSHAITTISYLTDIISITHSTCVLDALFIVLLGSDMAPEGVVDNKCSSKEEKETEESKAAAGMSSLSPEDRELIESIEDEAMRAKALAMLTGSTVATTTSNDNSETVNKLEENATNQAPVLRTALISWMALEDDTGHLALNTLRLFDTILASMNQFAYTSLVLRSFEYEPRESSHILSTLDAAADQELVRAVVERFLDASPSGIPQANPEAVVAAAMRIDGGGGDGTNMEQDEDDVFASPTTAVVPHHKPPLKNIRPSSNGNNSMRALLLLREHPGCDDYADDCLQRVRRIQRHTTVCWDPERYQRRMHGVSEEEELFYPGSFLSSLISQLKTLVKRHMAFNLMLTSMFNRLTSIGDPSLTAYLFLASKSTVRKGTHPMLYDSLVIASADAYVKSERVPRFAARLARQRREGVETAVRVGVAQPPVSKNATEKGDKEDTTPLALLKKPASSNDDMEVEEEENDSERRPLTEAEIKARNRAEIHQASSFLGTPIKRFVHGYIVLDEFAKEMAATALALHTLELEQAMDKQASSSLTTAVVQNGEGGYEDILDYFDPQEPGYRQAMHVKQSLKAEVIDLE